MTRQKLIGKTSQREDISKLASSRQNKVNYRAKQRKKFQKDPHSHKQSKQTAEPNKAQQRQRPPKTAVSMSTHVG